MSLRLRRRLRPRLRAGLVRISQGLDRPLIEATEVVHSLIDKIVLTPDAGENRLVSDLNGSLAGILGMATQEKAKPQPTDQVIAQQKAVIDGSKNKRSAL